MLQKLREEASLFCRRRHRSSRTRRTDTMFVVKRALKPAAAFGVATAFRQVRFPSSFPGDAPRRANPSRRIVDATIGAFIPSEEDLVVVGRGPGEGLEPAFPRRESALARSRGRRRARRGIARPPAIARPTLTTETPLRSLTHISTTSVNHENRLPTLPTCATSVRAGTRRT